MIDISDGLGGDARHLAEASKACLHIDGAAIPLAAGLQEVAAATGRDPLELAIGGGEDYELLASVPRERLEEAQQAVEEAEKGIALTAVGEVTDGTGVEIRLPGGAILEPAGYDQLA
jgi:thiamine-monophosphate kinase